MREIHQLEHTEHQCEADSPEAEISAGNQSVDRALGSSGGAAGDCQRNEDQDEHRHQSSKCRRNKTAGPSLGNVGRVGMRLKGGSH